MKKIFPFYLYPSYFKYLGLAFSILGVLLFLFSDSNYQLLHYFGLILIVFSKEKTESELCKQIRTETYKTVFGYFLALILAVFLAGIIREEIKFPYNQFFLLGVPLSFNIIYFHLLLLMNSKGNKKAGKRSRLMYALWILFVILTALLILL